MNQTLIDPSSAVNLDYAVSFQEVRRSFNQVEVLRGITLDVAPGEFLTLLGPSGCGKTTLLRIAAGFERPSSGTMLLDGRNVTKAPAHKRDINMVFQRPTLFPHLNVFDNVAFGLRLEKVPQADLKSRVGEALELVKLSGFEARRSVEMSGGQIQRVALARALVKRPKVLLLDEPLSALDLKIRLGMEAELRRIHRETGAVFIYVTHDQREALALSDRIAVFNKGSIEQCGTPEDIYFNPATPFIAGFVGDANVLPATVLSTYQDVAECDCAGERVRVGTSGRVIVGACSVVLRPEQIQVTADTAGAAAEGLTGVVADVAFRGTAFGYGVQVPGLPKLVKAEPAIRGEQQPLEVGTRVRLTWSADSGRVLPAHQM